MEAPHIIPHSWNWVKLKEIIKDIEKINYKKTNPDHLFKYVDISSIDNSAQKIVGFKKYHGKDAPSRARQLIKKDDILFSTVRTYLKNIARVDPIYDGEIASTGFCVIRPHDSILSKYLFFYVQTSEFLNPLNKIQRGTSYPAVRNGDVHEQIVPIPPFNEQIRIVSKIEDLFSRLDSGVKTLQQTQQQLEQYRQSILTQAFTGELTQKWRLKNINVTINNDVLNEKYTKLGLPVIPKEWKYYYFEYFIKDHLIGTVKSLKEQSKQNIGIKYLKMNNITIDGYLDLSDIIYVKYDEKDNKYLLKKGDLLVNTRNSYELVGKTTIIKEDLGEIIFNNNIARFRIVKDIDPFILSYQFNAPFFKSHVMKDKKATTNVCAWYLRDIKSAPIIWMPINEQKILLNKLDTTFSIIRKNKSTVEDILLNINIVKQSILKRAFEGHLVPQDERDEPASFLLERLKAEKAKAIPIRRRGRRRKVQGDLKFQLTPVRKMASNERSRGFG